MKQACLEHACFLHKQIQNQGQQYWNGLPHNRLPIAAEAALRSDPRYQNPGAAGFAGNQRHCHAPVAWVAARDEAAEVVGPVLAVAEEGAPDGVGVEAAVCPEHDYIGMSRQAGGYIDCT